MPYYNPARAYQRYTQQYMNRQPAQPAPAQPAPAQAPAAPRAPQLQQRPAQAIPINSNPGTNMRAQALQRAASQY